MLKKYKFKKWFEKFRKIRAIVTSLRLCRHKYELSLFWSRIQAVQYVMQLMKGIICTVVCYFGIKPEIGDLKTE